MTDGALTITDAAAALARQLMEHETLRGRCLRVFASVGDCAKELKYGFAFEKEPKAEDLVIEANGVRLLVDPLSAGYLKGSTVDVVDSFLGTGFIVKLPPSLRVL